MSLKFTTVLLCILFLGQVSSQNNSQMSSQTSSVNNSIQAQNSSAPSSNNSLQPLNLCSQQGDKAACYAVDNFVSGLCFWSDGYLHPRDWSILPPSTNITLPSRCEPVLWDSNCYVITTKNSCIYGECAWSDVHQRCGSYNSAECSDYSVSKCYYGIDCVIVTDNQGNQLCKPSNICPNIPSVAACLTDPLHCYWASKGNPHGSNCSQIVDQTSCDEIFQQANCLYSTCYWVGSTNLCVEYNNVNTPCNQLIEWSCSFGNKCEFDLVSQTCQPQILCSNNVDRASCNNFTLLNCFYSDIYQQCQEITGGTWCVDLKTQVNCQYGQCVWDTGKNLCYQIYQVACNKLLTQRKCQLGTNCLWNGNTCGDSQVNYNLCTAETNVDFCYKHNACYFNLNNFVCLPSNSQTACSFIKQKTNCDYSNCIWDEILSCIDYNSASCSQLDNTTCQYGTDCHFLAGICVLKRTCKDNDDIVSSCINDPLGCYFDYTAYECMAVGIVTNCNLMQSRISCNTGRCSWLVANAIDNTGTCVSYNSSPCEILTYLTCHYSEYCYWNAKAALQYQQLSASDQANIMNPSCGYRSFCQAYDNQSDKCLASPLSCWYDIHYGKCYPINGETDCRYIIGYDKCARATCQLQPDLINANALDCVEYQQAICSYMSRENCHLRSACLYDDVNKLCLDINLIAATLNQNVQLAVVNVSNVTVVQNRTIPSNLANNSWFIHIIMVSLILVI